jgi:hypothetical protein
MIDVDSILWAIAVLACLIVFLAMKTEAGECRKCDHCQRIKSERAAAQARADCKSRKQFHLEWPEDNC